MPPRHAYWTIIAGGLPTAFRAAEREELLPTFKGIQKKHPDAEMKYFARGRLWPSQEEARREAEARRAAAAQRQSVRGGTFRGRDWRPGGDHRDPHQTFKDLKKERNQERRKDRFERRQQSGATHRPADAPARPAQRPAMHAPRPKWHDRGPWVSKPAAAGDRPWHGRPPRDKPRGESYRRESKAGEVRTPAPPRPKGSYRPPKSSWGPKPAPRPRPAGPGNRPTGPPDRGRDQRGPTKDRRRRS